MTLLAYGSLDPAGPVAREIATLWWAMLALGSRDGRRPLARPVRPANTPARAAECRSRRRRRGRDEPAVRHPLVHGVEHVMFLATSLLFWSMSIMWVPAGLVYAAAGPPCSAPGSAPVRSA